MAKIRVDIDIYTPTGIYVKSVNRASESVSKTVIEDVKNENAGNQFDVLRVKHIRDRSDKN